ncbi:MAG: AMP-binding protein [Winogradskyella sp.]|uniref:AMP-binding protein n=1 Tax=Winogradskyella sp. TaxID=1883156 RepID=UPI0025F546CF|nr:AMP-binding protein [Winogradskyella sp.]NRB60171.1 AMP-binding protein [Winogradskyella sp.]
MNEILDLERLKVLINEIFWETVPSCRNIPFEGDLRKHLNIDSLDALDLASEFHFRFDMLSESKEQYLLQYDTAEDWLNQIYISANNPEKRFGFFSSGSTGQPTQVWHDKQQLIEERDFWLQITKAKGVICLVPVRHIYGFIWGLMLGTKLERSKFLNMKDWHKTSEYSNDDDLIIGHPTAWKHINLTFSHKYAVSSTAPIGKSLIEELKLDNIKGLNIYGSTETGAIGYQYWDNDYFKLLPYWQTESDKLTRDNFTFEIPDHIEWLSSSTFQLNGRKDKLIQIGGENVSLIEVEANLKKISGVKNVWVKPYHSHWGIRLFSYFQLQPEQKINTFEDKLIEHLKSLPSKLKPRKWEFSYDPFDKLNI